MVSENEPGETRASARADHGPHRSLVWDVRHVEYVVRRRVGLTAIAFFAILSSVLLGAAIAFLPADPGLFLVDAFLAFMLLTCLRAAFDLVGEGGDRPALRFRCDERGVELTSDVRSEGLTFAWDEIERLGVDDLADQLRLYVTIRGDARPRSFPFDYLFDVRVVIELISQTVDVELAIADRFGGPAPDTLAREFPTFPSSPLAWAPNARPTSLRSADVG